MSRKLLILIAILAALGIVSALPAAASATFLTDTSEGVTTLVRTGSKIKAIGNGTAIFTFGSGFTVECNENFLTGEVLKNNGTVEATITDAKVQSNLTTEGTKCRSNFGNFTWTTELTNETGGTKHWCIRSVAGTDTVELVGRNCAEKGSGNITFTFDFNGLTCKYSHEASLIFAFTTPTEHVASTLSLTGEPLWKKEEGLVCPAELRVVQLAFKLYTDTATSNETNIWDDAASTSDPVWFHETE
jgi:hypothetical protein